jgi:dCTP deaminase
MILTDKDIHQRLDAGQIRFEPEIERLRQVQDASVDLRLSPYLRIPDDRPAVAIQPTDRIPPELYGHEEQMHEDGFVLRPNRLVLGSTYEKVILPLDLAGRLEGRSSLARLGLIIHATSAHVAPGFSRPIVLEIVNLGKNNIVLKPMMYVAQIIFEQVSAPPSKAYSGQFSKQDRP